MSVALRTVVRADLPALARLHAQCFPEDAWDEAALAGILGMPGAQARLAEEVDRPLGLLFAIILREEAEILTLGVAPAAQRQGIARRLLDDLFTRAGEAGARRVVLEVAADNSAALALYETSGFGTVGIRHAYYQRERGAAIDAWLLRRVLG
jgi:[ribosomal protein S18]-alanine N-acetyltransferase